MSKLNQAPRFMFKCAECEYHGPIKGYWAVITRYPDQSMYQFLCVTCDENKVAEKEEVTV